MPFTPFHMGPGLFIKSVLNTSFSLIIFGWAQILMDIQPLFVLISGDGHLHGFSHTFIGASIIALFSGATGKYIIDWVVTSKTVGLTERDKAFFHLTRKFKWRLVFTSAYIGTFSHVYLDAIMHSDVQPFFPINLDNPIWGMLSVGMLHKACAYAGLLGFGAYSIIRWIRAKA